MLGRETGLWPHSDPGLAGERNISLGLPILITKESNGASPEAESSAVAIPSKFNESAMILQLVLGALQRHDVFQKRRPVL